MTLPDGAHVPGSVGQPAFTPGICLSEPFYEEAVRPILETILPGKPHSAALFGYGPDVLGYDTVRSTDHEWEPRLLLCST